MREGIRGAKNSMSSFVKMNRESGLPGRDVFERERWVTRGLDMGLLDGCMDE